MGRHVNHPDTSGMPFSYLIEHGNRSYLVPGANLKSVGTIRDAQKWPKRDKRTDPDKLDCINFNLLSPYTIQKMLQGIDTLQGMLLLPKHYDQEQLPQQRNRPVHPRCP